MASIAVALADYSFVPQTVEKISVLIPCLVKSCPCKLNPLPTRWCVNLALWSGSLTAGTSFCVWLSSIPRTSWQQQHCSGGSRGVLPIPAGMGCGNTVLQCGGMRWSRVWSPQVLGDEPTAAVLGRMHLVFFFLELNTISLSKNRISTHSEMWNSW